MVGTDKTEDAAGPQVKQPGLKFLEAAVYIMGGLIILMVFGLLAGIGWKIMHKPAPETPSVQATDIALPEGGTIAGITLDGDRMAVHVSKGAEHEIIIIDTRKGAVTSRVRLAPGIGR